MTDQYAGAITSTGNSFSVNFGEIAADESYAISYGATVNQGYNESNFGTQYNQAAMSESGEILHSRKIPLIMFKGISGSNNLRKTVNRPELSTNKSFLSYTLRLTSTLGTLKAGAIVTDPLPKNTTYLSTQIHENFTDATYDRVSNTLTYTLLKDIPEGESRDIQFTVDYDDMAAQVGDKVVNWASYGYAGSEIYSNDATTLISESVSLQKLNEEIKNPLSGAVFKLIDSNGVTVIENLVSDSNGMVHVGLLRPGNYAFVETKSPEGYELDSTPHPFTIVEGQTETIKLMMTNKKKEPLI